MKTDSIMALNCDLCQSEFSVLSDRLIIRLSKNLEHISLYSRPNDYPSQIWYFAPTLD